MPRYGTMVSCRTAATTAPTAARVRLIWRDPRRGAWPLCRLIGTRRRPRWRLRPGQYTDRPQIRAIVLNSVAAPLVPWGPVGPERAADRMVCTEQQTGRFDPWNAAIRSLAARN